MRKAAGSGAREGLCERSEVCGVCGASTSRTRRRPRARAVPSRRSALPPSLAASSASGERSPGASKLVGRAERGGPRACAAQVFLIPALTAAGKVSPQWATKVFVSLEILDDLS